MIKKSKLFLGVLVILLASGKAYAIPKDINGHWAREDIITLEALGIMDSYKDGSFKPRNYISRGEYIDVVENFLGYREGGSGYKENITREECLEILGKALGYENVRPESIYNFKDYESISNNSTLYVNLLYEKGYISGDECGKFNPKSRITRGEVARILNLVNKESNNKPKTKGNYQVQMGSFLSLESAKLERNTLIKKGYPNALVVKFKDYSQYSVLVDHSLSEEYSNNLHMELLNQGIDSNIISRQLRNDEILVGNKQEVIVNNTNDYSVQTGVFSNTKIANTYKNSLVKQGFKDSFVLEESGKVFVLAGTGLDKEDADELTVKLISKGFEAFPTKKNYKGNTGVSPKDRGNDIVWEEKSYVSDLKYYVQAGVFSNYKGAEDLYYGLKKKSFTSPILYREDGKYIVISRAYLDKTTGTNHLSQLKSNGIDGMIKTGKKLDTSAIILK